MSSILQARGLDAMRRITDLFIADDPVTISLIPYQKNDLGGGMYEYGAQTARDPQNFRLIQTFPNHYDGNVYSDGLRSKEWPYLLICSWNAEVEMNDQWEDNNITYKVMSVHPINNYEIHCVVVASATKPEHG